MALFKKKPKTSQQKAQKAQMGIMARLIGCAYLIYIVYKLLRSTPENESMNPTLKIAVAVFFLSAAAFVITLTVIEFIRNWKAGNYRVSAFTDDPGIADESEDEVAELPEPDGETESNDETEIEDEPESEDESELDDESEIEDEPESEDESELDDGTELEDEPDSEDAG